MAEGRFNFMIAALLLLSSLASVKSALTANNSVSSADGKKIFITASQMDIVISSNQETKLILQKLETLSAENKQLVKKFQSLEKRLLTLEGRVTRRAFLFPRKGVSDYVLLTGMPRLSAITACLWMKSTDTENAGTPLGYAVPGTDNEFIIYNYKAFHVFVGGQHRVTSISAIDGMWHHICATWENTAGSWRLYKNGAVAAEGRGLNRGHTIRGSGYLVLGQEQDTVGGKFSASQNFIGEMTGVNIWSRVLGNREIANLSKSCLAGEGNVFKWSDFESHIRGGVQLIYSSCAVQL